MNQSMVSIKYVGKRDSYIDGAFGTRIHFDRGDSRMVPADIAKLMLKHPDVYVPGEPDALTVAIHAPKTQDDDTQDMRDAIVNMDHNALATYAKTHFSVKLDKRKDVGALRSQVTGLFDQFGLK